MLHIANTYTEPEMSNHTTAVLTQAPADASDIAAAPIGSSSVAYDGAMVDQSLPASVLAAEQGTIPRGSSTLYAGWVGPSPVNTQVLVTDLTGPGVAPGQGLDRTPFARRMLMRFWQQVTQSQKALPRWDGLKAEMTSDGASTPIGTALAGTSDRVNTWRLAPSPWDAGDYIGASPSGNPS